MPQTHTAPLSPAQKAWQTRRAQGWQPKAKAPARVALLSQLVGTTTTARAPAPYVEPDWMKPREIAAPIDAMDPATEFEMVEYWVDHPDVGCGQFRFIVLDRGRRKVRLFYISRLTAIVVNRDEFDRYYRPALKASRRTVADIIRRNVAQADRINDQAQAPVANDGGVFGVRALHLVTGEGRR